MLRRSELNNPTQTENATRQLHLTLPTNEGKKKYKKRQKKERHHKFAQTIRPAADEPSGEENREEIHYNGQ